MYHSRYLQDAKGTMVYFQECILIPDTLILNTREVTHGLWGATHELHRTHPSMLTVSESGRIKLKGPGAGAV